MLQSGRSGTASEAKPFGGAVARAFAREGARVYLAGRTLTTLESVAEAIHASGGSAEATTVDALDEQSVEAFVSGVAAQEGRINISFNTIGLGDVQAPPAE
jgi:3-oxoacyl-[acyl-carrier protein] reductase